MMPQFTISDEPVMSTLDMLTDRLKKYQQKLDDPDLWDAERAFHEELLRQCKEAISIYEWDNSSLD